MEHGIRQGLAPVEAAVGDLQRIAQKLISLSEAGVARGLAHTEGVDTLIGFVDRVESVSPLARERSNGPLESGRTALGGSRSDLAVSTGVGGLPDLCQEIRRKAADLDRLNRDGVAAASELSEQAEEITRVEIKLREWLASVREAPTRSGR
ncbi:MAG: hypothetical protein ACE5MM_05070 [Nitrospiraceae bacterium]